MSEREGNKPWTAGEVLYHLNALRESDLQRFNERFQAQEKSMTAAFEAQQRAVATAEANAEKWRANANEWRAAMTDRERNFFSKGMGLVSIALGIVATILTIFSYIK